MMEWIKAIYGAVGAGYPTTSLIVVALIGTLLFGGAWWVVGQQYRRDHPAVIVNAASPLTDAPNSAPDAPLRATDVPPTLADKQETSERPPARRAASEGGMAQSGSQTDAGEGTLRRNEQRTSGDNSPAIVGSNNTITINQGASMRPQIEGLTPSFRQMPSPRPDAPFAVEVVIQVQAAVSPVSLGFYIDQPLVEGRVRSPSAMMNVVQGTLNDDPKRSFWIAFDFPALTPTQPLVVQFVARQAFSVTRIVRVSR